MANYIRVRAGDFIDGIPATVIPKGPTMNLVGNVRFVPTTECSRLKFTCTGTSFSVQIVRDSTSVINAVYNDCAVFVDGKYAGKFTPTLNVVAWYPFTMSSGGAHEVELQCGQGGVNGGSLYMTCGQILAIAGTNITLDRSPAATNRRLWIFGDSIIMANGATDTVGVTDFLALLRAKYPGRVTGDCMGTLAYTPWTDNNWIIERIKKHTAGAAVVDLLFQLGVNDYLGASVTSLTPQLTTMYTAIVTAGIPGLSRVVVLTPISKLSEVANGSGFTLGNVRTQIANAAAATAIAAPSAPKITVVNGSTFGIDTTNDLYDGLHPNSAGALKMFNGIRPSLGI